MTVAGCTAAPAVKARIAGVKSGKPRLKVEVVAAAGRARLTRVDV